MGLASKYHKAANSARAKIGEFYAVRITVEVPDQNTDAAIERARAITEAKRHANDIRRYLMKEGKDRKAVNTAVEKKTKVPTDWGHTNAVVWCEERARACQNFINNINPDDDGATWLGKFNDLKAQLASPPAIEDD